MPANAIHQLDKLISSGLPYLDVKLSGTPVGKLAKTRDGVIAFQYDKSWIENGYSVSPFSLPLEDKVFLANPRPFSGLHGVFDDSTPDGWGRLLLDRLLRKHGLNPLEIDPLIRLAIVGNNGMGALEYVPSIELVEDKNITDLDYIAKECAEILSNDNAGSLDELYVLGGSSGGARPKILTEIDGEDWIVKFPSSLDPKNIGAQEYELALKAKACGIEMSEVRLMPSNICEGYFATKRFDRAVSLPGAIPNKVHMASAGALLETSHRIPNLDYDILLKLTLKLTNNMTEVMKMFKLMTFNVFAGNRDDHAKNFTYLCNKDGVWRLSPAYDLTENAGMNGEHATTVNGKGKDITREDLEAVGLRAGLSPADVRNAIDCVQSVF